MWDYDFEEDSDSVVEDEDKRALRAHMEALLADVL